MQTDSKVAQREQAKADLKKALADHNGDTKQVAVVEAITQCQALPDRKISIF